MLFPFRDFSMVRANCGNALVGVLACLFTGFSGAQVSTFSTDFASSPSGMTLNGDASRTDGELQLVPASASQQGSAIFASPAGSKVVQVFDVSCDVYTGNAANASLPADGWCFAWGNVSGSFNEEGPANYTGLVVSFDYYINDPEPGREVTVRWNGSQVASVLYDAYSAGAIAPVRIRVRSGGLLDVSHNGNQLFSGFALPNFTGLADPKFAFGARTGGQTAKVAFDGLTISALGMADQTMLEDGEPLEIMMSSAPTAQPSAASANTNLLSQSGISITGSGTTRTLRLTPQANAHGTAVVTVTDSVSGYTSTFTLTVTPVNDAPSYSKGLDIRYSAGKAGLQTYAYWASSISAGPADEVSQTLIFEVDNNTPSLFAFQPEISPDGTLYFAPAPQVSGAATVTVRLKDNGGTANSSSDASAEETFTITIGGSPPRFHSEFTGALPSGAWGFGNSAAIGNEIQLVSGGVSEQGALVVQNITGSEPVTTFDVFGDMFTGAATNPSLPADGWSFAVGDVPLTSFSEEGPPNFNGLVISCDYYINAASGETRREVSVRWNGQEVGNVPYDAYVHETWHTVYIRMRRGGLLDVWHNENKLFDGLAIPGFTGITAPRWGFGARTGGLTAKVAISTLSINPEPFKVTTLADGGAGSLREAISDTADTPGYNQIQFATALTGQTITLTGGELFLGPHGLVIDASTLPIGITISGNAQSRIFNADNSFSNVHLNRLTLKQGIADESISTYSGYGGGVITSGSLEMEDCTVSHCTADDPGGAIAVRASGKLKLTRCTVNHNTSESGGGIASLDTAQLSMCRCTVYGNAATEEDAGGVLVEGGIASIRHCTISENTSVDTAGGLRHKGGPEGASLILENCIIAGNSAPNYPDGKFDSAQLTMQGVSVIGVEDDTAPISLRAGFPNASGHFIGSVSLPLDVGLHSFGDHGGQTATLLLQSTSIARDACATSTSTSDQRGFSLLGSADAGAFEAQISRMANVAMNEDNTQSISITTGTVGTLSATSGQQVLIQPSGLVVTGIESERSLAITPMADQYGPSLITVTDSLTGETGEFTLIVQPVNDAPSFTLGATQTMLMGNISQQVIAGWATEINPGPNESGQSLQFSLSTQNPGMFAIQPQVSAEGTLTYAMASQALGTTEVTVRLTDNGGTANDGANVAEQQITFVAQAGASWDFDSIGSAAGLLHGNASYQSSSQSIKLLPFGTNLTGSLIIPSITEERLITNFDVGFDVTIARIAPNYSVADGFSLVWGDIPAAAFGEDGPNNFTGLVVTFDFYEKKLRVKWNNSVLQSLDYDSFNSSKQPVHVRLHYGGLLNVYHANTRVVHDLQLPGFSGLNSPRWGLGARSGSEISQVNVDNLRINPTPFVVTSAANSGAGTLRQVVLDAASSYAQGANQIHFDPAVEGQSINLTTTQINIGDQNVHIDASMLANGMTLDANYNSRLLDSDDATGRVALRRLTLTRGKPGSADGGAMDCRGFLELDDCTFSHCIGKVGGALLLVTTTLYADGCTFHSNSADAGAVIWMQNGGNLTCTRCTITQNTSTSSSGGAMTLLDGSTNLTHCTISGNTATSVGGGISMQSPATLQIANSIIAGNTAQYAHDVNYFGAALTSLGGNVIGIGDTNANGSITPGLPNANGDFVGSESSAVNARLSALENFGGPTQTMIVLGNSPALNFASTSTSTADQRGFPMVGLPDAGAYEAGTARTYGFWSLENAGITTATADDDSDGQTNQLEYAFRTNPLISNSNTAFRILSAQSLEFPFRPEATDLCYKVQASSDLSEWIQVGEAICTPSGTFNTGAATINQNTKTVSVSDPTTQPRRFWRVLVTSLLSEAE
jgi:hypothetical protein